MEEAESKDEEETENTEVMDTDRDDSDPVLSPV